MGIFEDIQKTTDFQKALALMSGIDSHLTAIKSQMDQLKALAVPYGTEKGSIDSKVADYKKKITDLAALY